VTYLSQMVNYTSVTITSIMSDLAHYLNITQNHSLLTQLNRLIFIWII